MQNLTQQTSTSTSSTDFSADLLRRLEDIPEEVQKKWPKDLSALIDIYSASLQRLGYNQQEASKISHILLAEQAVYCGGRYFYLPKPDALKKAVRDVEIHRDWSERNMLPEALAAKYQLSNIHIYRILKQQQNYRRHTRLKQNDG